MGRGFSSGRLRNKVLTLRAVPATVSFRNQLGREAECWVKREPPTERSGALRDAPVLITYWGDFLPGRAA
jgi:hypothetical protein